MAYNILIVDDSLTMRKVIHKCIVLSGFDMGECWEAGDGQEALAVLRAREVDLILSDLNMPEMNGMAMFQELKKDENLRRIPVLFITTFGREKAMPDGPEMEIQGYIQKPFHPEMIRDSLERILEKKFV